MTNRPMTWLGILACLVAAEARAQAPKPFAPPKDRAEWEARRGPLRLAREESEAKGLPPRPASPRFEVEGREARPGVMVERIALDVGVPDWGKVGGILVVPEGADSSRRVPLILLAVEPGHRAIETVDRPGLDGRPPALALASFGYAVLAIDHPRYAGAALRCHRVALDAATARPEFDLGKIAAFGLGFGGLDVLRLMAVDDRVACGVAAVEAWDRSMPIITLTGGGPTQVLTATPDDLAPLCAPRPLALMVGEPIPFPTNSVARAIERAVKATYKVYGPEGTGLAMNIYGEFPGHDTVRTRLAWMAGLEQLDKHLRPQGPAPLGHAAEPEPVLDGRFIDLAEKGIAGWSAEMAQRPGTWTWSDGVIACRPGPGEFGWLRAPIEVADFVLKVEWRVPEKGNGGIFLRARPVDWTLPPGDPHRLKLHALGLDWPSRTGLELQAQADPGIADRYSSGSLYRHAAPAANSTLPPGQWNRYTVRARGLRVEVWSNGQQVLDTTLDRHAATLPDPPLRGYLGLQNHGSPGEYRAVRLRVLD